MSTVGHAAEQQNGWAYHHRAEFLGDCRARVKFSLLLLRLSLSTLCLWLSVLRSKNMMTYINYMHNLNISKSVLI